jgi:signal transduction histidine kinase
LTNTARHGGAAVTVRIENDEQDQLLIMISDDGGARTTGLATELGSGYGLTGLSERLHTAGGRLDYGPTGRHGFAVSAVIPLEPSAVRRLR